MYLCRIIIKKNIMTKAKITNDEILTGDFTSTQKGHLQMFNNMLRTAPGFLKREINAYYSEDDGATLNQIEEVYLRSINDDAEVRIDLVNGETIIQANIYQIKFI